jgi:hypothetical protein
MGKAMKWISITKALPPLYVSVLVYAYIAEDDDWGYAVASRSDPTCDYSETICKEAECSCPQIIFNWAGRNFLYNVTHWMPLPSSPEPELPEPPKDQE